MKFAIVGIIGAAVLAAGVVLIGPFGAVVALALVLLVAFVPGVGIMIATPIALFMLWLYDVLDFLPMVVLGIGALFIGTIALNVSTGRKWNEGMDGNGLKEDKS